MHIIYGRTAAQPDYDLLCERSGIVIPTGNAEETAGEIILIQTVCKKNRKNINAIHNRQGSKESPILLLYHEPHGKFFIFH